MRPRRRPLADFYPFKQRRELTAAVRDAGRAVNHAVTAGTLVRKPCEQCGKGKAEAHHEDYTRPLDVVWLCRFHHRQRDAELRIARRDAAKAADVHALPQAYLKRQALLQSHPFAANADRRNRSRKQSFVVRDYSVVLVTQATQAIWDAIAAEDLTPNALAKRVGASRQCLSAHFNGGFRTLKVIAAYADALGYDAQVVLTKRPVVDTEQVG